MHVAMTPVRDAEPLRAQVPHIVRRDRPRRETLQRGAGDDRRLGRKIIDAAAVLVPPPIDHSAVGASLPFEMQAVLLLQTPLVRLSDLFRVDLDRGPMLRSVSHRRLPPVKWASISPPPSRTAVPCKQRIAATKADPARSGSRHGAAESGCKGRAILPLS